VRRVLVTGASHPLGRAVASRLRATSGVEDVVEHRFSGSGSEGDPAAGRWTSDHRDLVRIVREREVDTVVQCSLAPDRRGDCTEPMGGDVIGTMSLCAAVSDARLAVRSLVLASSSAVYPLQSYKPLLHREEGETERDESLPAASLLEAEEYARDVAARSPHLNVAILRLAEIAGPGVLGPLSALLRPWLVPAAVGFDPLVQFTHVDDAVNAIVFASRVELAGAYNVASAGVLRWSEAIQALGKWSAPVLPLSPGPLQPLLRALRVPHVPNGLVGMLRFGLTMDTAKLASAGFTPAFDQLACIGARRAEG